MIVFLRHLDILITCGCCSKLRLCADQIRYGLQQHLALENNDGRYQKRETIACIACVLANIFFLEDKSKELKSNG